MKKMIAAIAALAMMVVGLVGFSAGSASAGPYAGTVNTWCNAQAVKKVIRPHHRARMQVTVRNQGNAEPKGRVVITIKKRMRNGNWKFVNKIARKYTGPGAYGAGRLHKKGKYKIVTKFRARNGSVFQHSWDKSIMRVRR